jgi:hypothetical protein
MLLLLAWTGTLLVPFLTNSTKIVRIANVTHTTIAFVYETLENTTNLGWLPLDLMLVGQPIQMKCAGRFNLMNDTANLFQSDDL